MSDSDNLAPPPQQSSWRGRLYGFAFYTELTQWRGLRRSVWVRLIALLFFTLSLFLTLLFPLPLWLILPPFALLLATQWLYWAARRAGYVAFTGLHTAVAPQPTTTLRKEEKIPVRATGLFSVMERERYLLQKKADYWHYPLSEHVIMVEEAPGKYLYQFVSASRIRHIKAGHLYLGQESFPALEINYHTDWAPSLLTGGINYYVGGGVPDEDLPRRTIYLTFHTTEDWQRVWHSFVR
jgi:hypothetical protein